MCQRHSTPHWHLPAVNGWAERVCFSNRPYWFSASCGPLWPLVGIRVAGVAAFTPVDRKPIIEHFPFGMLICRYTLIKSISGERTVWPLLSSLAAAFFAVDYVSKMRSLHHCLLPPAISLPGPLWAFYRFVRAIFVFGLSSPASSRDKCRFHLSRRDHS